MFMWLCVARWALRFRSARQCQIMSVPVEVGKLLWWHNNPLHKLKISLLPSEHVDASIHWVALGSSMFTNMSTSLGSVSPIAIGQDSDLSVGGFDISSASVHTWCILSTAYQDLVSLVFFVSNSNMHHCVQRTKLSVSQIAIQSNQHV